MLLRFQREATEELDEAIAWYNAQQAELGLAFHAAVRAVLESIGVNPRFGFRSTKNGCRFSPTDRFPYVVFGMEVDDGIRILAISPAKRKLEYWRNRIPES